MQQNVYLVYLDRYHGGDPLFVKDLAERLKAAEGRPGAYALIHGSGEKVERTLESEGLFIEREGGVLQVETAEQRRLVERAIRETNQQLVGTLTDAQVSAVGLQGTGRSLLRLGAEGRVTAGHLGWVKDLIRMRVLPVISALVAEEGGGGTVREAPAVEAALAVAEALAGGGRAITLVFLAQRRLSGLLAGAEAETLPQARLDALIEADALPEPDAVRRAVDAGAEVLVASLEGLLRAGGPEGVRLARPAGSAA